MVCRCLLTSLTALEDCVTDTIASLISTCVRLLIPAVTLRDDP